MKKRLAEHLFPPDKGIVRYGGLSVVSLLSAAG